MKKLFLVLAACLMMGCVEEAYVVPPGPPVHPSYGCAIIEDEYGEREVCDVYYYPTEYGVLYWDTTYGMWIGAGGYWRGGIWFHGYLPGYVRRYGGFYHEHGYHWGYNRGYYGHHWGGAWHGNPGFHGGFRGGSPGGHHR